MVEAARTVRQELGVREATGMQSNPVVALPIPEPVQQAVPQTDYMGL